MPATEKLIYDIIGKTDNLTPQKYLLELCEGVLPVLKADGCYLFEMDEDDNALYLGCSIDANLPHLNYTAKIPKGKGIAGWTALYQQPLLIENTATDVHYAEELKFIAGEHDESALEGNNSILAIPLVAFGVFRGVMTFLSRRHKFSRQDVEFMQPFANMVALGLQYRNNHALMQLAEVCIRFLEERDRYTHGHSLRVMQYCLIIAEELNLTEVQRQNLRLCATLHDIGKVTLKDSLLHNETSSLTKLELQAIRMHAVVGFNIVSNINKALAYIILSHHEHYNGRGYPHGLKQEEIPQLSRIICLADAFDAMTSDRPYRKALELPDVIGEIRRNSGQQFDPLVVEAFLSAYRAGKINYSGADSSAKLTPSLK